MTKEERLERLIGQLIMENCSLAAQVESLRAELESQRASAAPALRKDPV